MILEQIYYPIREELENVNKVLHYSLNNSEHQYLSKISNFLLESTGKRIRPALVILSAKSIFNGHPLSLDNQIIKIAAAIELIHIASLIHDDVIDKAPLRHNRPTVNYQWGDGVAVALGDYIYALAFELVSHCGSLEVFHCITSAAKELCEGELVQVKDRDNFDLSKEQYFFIIKKKTAALFAASCQCGGLIFSKDKRWIEALYEYGLNFGMAFQIIDDYLDIMGKQETIGKLPGQDIKEGELTLPIMNLWEFLSTREKEELKSLLSRKSDNGILEKIRKKMLTSGAAEKTREIVASFTNSAKERINILSSSPYKDSLINLADFIYYRGFENTKKPKAKN
jgi:octaprenyl-diphosphate synthase